MRLQPFFTYYGGKYRAAPFYPAPLFETIVEPFAGSAGYALRYYDRNIILYELDPRIYGIWDFLLHSKPTDIYAIPTHIKHIDDVKNSQEARWLVQQWISVGKTRDIQRPSSWMRGALGLVGLWLNSGSAQPKNIPTTWMKSGSRVGSFWGEKVKNRIVRQLPYIRHWRIFNKSYEECPNYENSTWFIDPPYSGHTGKSYRYNKIDYDLLARWCRLRFGQVIVCEGADADWLPFDPLGRIRATHNPNCPNNKAFSNEVIFLQGPQGLRKPLHKTFF